MGKLVLLSNFRDGYPEMIKKVADKESVIFSYIPSRTEFGEIYYNRKVHFWIDCINPHFIHMIRGLHVKF